MKKQDFLNQLRKELDGLPSIDLEDILRDQEEMINDAIASGRDEEAVIKSFGDPKDLAKSLKAEIKIEKAVDEKQISKQARNLFAAVGALLVLAPFNLIFVLGPFLAIMGILFAGWVVTLVFGLLAFVMMFIFFGELLFLGTALTVQLSTFFTFLGSIGFSILLVVGMYFITKWVFKLILSYLRWNLNFITGQVK